MRTFRLFTLFGLLMAVSQLSAQNQYVYADPVTIEAGGDAEVVVNMNLDLEEYEKVGVCFFLLDLPTGIEVTNTENPAKSCTLSAELVGELDESLTDKVFHVYDNYGAEGRFLLYLDVNKGSFTLKGSQGELLRMSVRSALAEALTFTPQITYVHIADDKGLPFVTDGVREKRNDYNTLYIDDMEACTGDELTLSVKLTNKVPCEAFSFLMLIPGGTSYVKDDEGTPLAALSYERISPSDIETFEVSIKDNHLLRVLVTTNGTPFSGNDGEVFTVRIRIEEPLKEGFNSIMLYDVSVSDVNAVSYDISMKSVHLKVSGLHRGDANGDGNLTVADMTAIAHHVTGNTPNGFSETAADANKDGQVNVADYTAVAHLLLYGTIEAPAQTAFYYHMGKKMPLTRNEPGNMMYISPVTTFDGEEATLSVKMRNAVDAEGFQFTLCLPEGVSVVSDDEGAPEASLSTERTTATRTNTFVTSLQPDGNLKVMGASTNGLAISAGDGEVCTVRIKVSAGVAKADYALLLSDVAISDTQARSHDAELVEGKLTVGSSAAITATLNDKGEMTNEKCFDLQGRKINGQSRKGIYIRDGKKFNKH